MCTISIANNFTGTPTSATTTDVLVTGTSTNCKYIQVSILCQGTWVVSPPISTGGISAWQYQFSGLNCPCNSDIRVKACCVSVVQNGQPVVVSEDCCDEKAGKLICPSEPDCCLDFVVTTTIGECVNGKRQVDFDIKFDITDERCLPYQFYLKYGDNSPNSATQTFSSFGNNQHFIDSHLYSPGNYTAILHYVTHPNCPPLNIPLTIRPCNPNCCPNAVAVITSEVIIPQNQKKECNPDGETKTVKVDAVITPTPQPGCPTNIQAEMWIDNNLVATGSGSSPFTLSHQGDFKCGDHNVVITFPGSNCPDSGGIFCVSVCETDECWNWRISFQIAATGAITSWLLYICNLLLSGYLSPQFTAAQITAITSVRIPLLILAVSATIIWIVLHTIWIKTPCKITCKKCRCLLNSWMIALASFVCFLVMSKCSFISLYNWLAQLIGPPYGPLIAVIIIILIMLIWIIIILILYLTWVAKCCPTLCEKWKRFLETLLLISTPVIAGIAITLGNTAMANYWLFPNIQYYFGLLVVLVGVKTWKICKW